MKYLILLLLLSVPFVMAERTISRPVVSPLVNVSVPQRLIAPVQNVNIPRLTPIVNISAPRITAPVCQSGASRCEGSTFQLCKNNAWTRVQTCTKSQVCAKNGCVSTEKQALQTISKANASFVCPVVKIGSKPLKAPFDLSKGDCALKGKPINAYLDSLQKKADECKKLVTPNWNQVVQSVASLHQKIDSLPSGSNNTFTASASCMDFDDGDVAPFETSKSVGADMYYSDWIFNIGKSVQKYCDNVQSLIAPVANTCSKYKKEINCIIKDRSGVTDGERAVFHMGISSASSASKGRYDSLGFAYSSTIVENIGNFKKNFNEKNVCTTKKDNSSMMGKEEE